MTAAAQLLHTTQPNISRFVASLERATKLTLFQRLPGRVVPTDEALALYKEVERVFLGMDALERSVQIIRQSSFSKLCIATVGSSAAAFVPQAIRRFLLHYPDTRLSTQHDSSPGVTNLVASRICDVGFATHLGHTAGVHVERLCTFDGVCVVHEDHRLARKQIIRPGDLSGESFISLPLGHPSRSLIDQRFEGTDLRIHRLEIATSQSICDLVEAGLGVSIINPLNLRPLPQTRLRFRPFEPPIEFATYLLTSEVAPPSALCTHFIESARLVVIDVVRDLDRNKARRA